MSKATGGGGWLTDAFLWLVVASGLFLVVGVPIAAGYKAGLEGKSLRWKTPQVDPRRRVILPGDEERTAQAGPRPERVTGGACMAVVRYLRDHLDDPDSLEEVAWFTTTYLDKQRAWVVRLKYRARNRLGARILQDQGFLIRYGEVTGVIQL